jgi:hypothetical protein
MRHHSRLDESPGRHWPDDPHPITLWGELFGLEVEGQGVYAVALASGLGAVIEDVAQVPAASATDHFGPHHAVALVCAQLNGLGDSWFVKAWPSRPGFKFCPAPEKDRPAPRAAVATVLVIANVLSGPGWFSRCSPQYLVLVGAQRRAPLVVGLRRSWLFGHCARVAPRQPLATRPPP